MKKNKHICVRATAQQRNYIENQAKISHKTLSEYVIKCCMNKKITNIEGLKDVRYQLQKIGNNINQLTKKANTGTTVISLDNVKRELQIIWQLLTSLIEKTT